MIEDIEENRIKFRKEPGRPAIYEAQYLRKQLLKALSREIARYQRPGLPVPKSFRHLQFDLQSRCFHVDNPARRDKGWWVGRWSLVPHLQNRKSGGKRTVSS